MIIDYFFFFKSYSLLFYCDCLINMLIQVQAPQKRADLNKTPLTWNI